MYTPNDYLGAAHQRLLHVTSDEVNADALANHSIEPAQNYGAWQHLPPGLLPLPNGHAFTAHHALSPPPEAHGFIDHVGPFNETTYLPEPWGIGQVSHQITCQYAERRLPTPPPRNNGLQKLLPRADRPIPTHIPQELPSSLHNLLPRTREYLASSPNIVNANGSTIWNTDGTGGSQDDWPVNDQSQPALPGLLTPAWDRSPVYRRQPQSPDYAATYQAPYTQPVTLQYVPPHHPSQSRRASSIASSPTLIDYHGQPTLMPPIQEWRTDNLATSAKSSRRRPDAATRRKQEAYRRKVEARRHTIAAGMPETQTLAHRALPTPGPSRPKATGHAKRCKVTPAVVPEICRKPRPTTATKTYKSPYDDTLSASTTLDYLQPRMAVYNSTVVELPPQTRDELPQRIVSKYEDYKWSVYHYELLPKGYDFAERWLQALFATTLQFEYHDRHFSHVSQGFIKDGGRHSLLVLHNAVNPFEYEPTPDSTVTIGAYGYHWYQHNEIHWTTLASDQRSLIAQCVQAGFLEEKHKWTFDAEKATEKRFHRAYWLAANRRDLKDLLNRGPSDDKPHDLSEDKSEEDPDKDFSISETDLTNEWNVTGPEAAAAWRKVQDEVDMLGDGFDVYGEGWQHVVTSNSEWSFSR